MLERPVSRGGRARPRRPRRSTSTRPAGGRAGARPGSGSAVTPAATAFRIARSRRGRSPWSPARRASRRRSSSATASPPTRGPRARQVCWAHLRRDMQAMIDRAAGGEAVGRRSCCTSPGSVFAWWRAARCRRDPPADAAGLRRRAAAGRPVAAGAGRGLRLPPDGDGLPRSCWRRAVAVDLRGGRGRAAAQQRGGAGAAARGDLAEDQPRHGQRGGAAGSSSGCCRRWRRAGGEGGDVLGFLTECFRGRFRGHGRRRRCSA